MAWADVSFRGDTKKVSKVVGGEFCCCCCALLTPSLPRMTFLHDALGSKYISLLSKQEILHALRSISQLFSDVKSIQFVVSHSVNISILRRQYGESTSSVNGTTTVVLFIAMFSSLELLLCLAAASRAACRCRARMVAAFRTAARKKIVKHSAQKKEKF
jgi:hypothetical protein